MEEVHMIGIDLAKYGFQLYGAHPVRLHPDFLDAGSAESERARHHHHRAREVLDSQPDTSRVEPLRRHRARRGRVEGGPPFPEVLRQPGTLDIDAASAEIFPGDESTSRAESVAVLLLIHAMSPRSS